jgi:hypothetical protein
LLASPFRALQAARKSFWNSEKPAAWTPEEKQQLLWQSPWAREGTLRFAMEKGQRSQPTGGGTAPVEVPGSRPGGMPAGKSVTFGDSSPGRPPSADKGEPPQFRVMVRWESAKPVQLAGGRNLPEETAQYYVILLLGMPLMRPRADGKNESEADPNQGMLEEIKRTSRIERKDKEAIPCAHLLTGKGERATELLLFFPKSADPITTADKEVTVACRFGSFQLSVRFPLKEMMFGGSLEL